MNLRNWLRSFARLPGQIHALRQELQALKSNNEQYFEQLQSLKHTLGRMCCAGDLSSRSTRIEDWEFQVFSQSGDDGIIQHLIHSVPSCEKTFVEFGVENYIESNTRFLVTHDYWAGLVMDGSDANINYIRNDPIYTRRKIKAIQAFVTAENINDLLKAGGFTGELGLLSIDVDGNDYWIWNAVTVVRPCIVVIEYNARFGNEKAIVVPYAPNFVRQRAHYSMIYYGASLAALVGLGQSKGYDFVGCNSYGNNAFFVRSDIRPSSVPLVSFKSGYRKAQFQESRDTLGRLAFLSEEDELRIINELPVQQVLGPAGE